MRSSRLQDRVEISADQRHRVLRAHVACSPDRSEHVVGPPPGSAHPPPDVGLGFAVADFHAPHQVHALGPEALDRIFGPRVVVRQRRLAARSDSFGTLCFCLCIWGRCRSVLQRCNTAAAALSTLSRPLRACVGNELATLPGGDFAAAQQPRSLHLVVDPLHMLCLAGEELGAEICVPCVGGADPLGRAL